MTALGSESSNRWPKFERVAAVEIYEAGIGGIGLVQELMNGYEALIIVDAVEKEA